MCYSGNRNLCPLGGNPHNCWTSGSDSATELTNRGGASRWASPQPNTVTTATDCQLAGCTANDKVLNAAKTQCVDLPDRYYKDSVIQQAVSCGSVHASVSAGSGNWVANQAGVTGQSDCEIQCGNGYQPADSSATGSTAECEQKCSLGSTPNFGYAPENSGRHAWDSKTSTFSSTCRVEVCNAGYDDDDNDNTCEETEKGYYSAGNNKTRTQCSTDGTKNQPIPGDASWQGTGLTTAGACRWSCNSGYHISADSTSCASNDCSNEIDDGAGERTSHSGACQVTGCGGGYYEKTTGTCREVEANLGYYSTANDKSITQCSVSVTLPDHATWTNKAGSAVSGDCTWNCKSSWKKDSTTCVGPSVAGKYIDSGVEKDCRQDGSLAALKGGGLFVAPAGGRTMAQSCDFTCPGNKVKNTADRNCDTAGTGKFIVGGVEKSCATGSNMDLASRKGSGWASSQPEVQTAANCKLATCSGTHVFTDTSKTRCRALITGEYQKTDHTEGSCVAIANSQFTSDGGASNIGCTYTCTDGFVDGRHDSPATRTCTAPAPGHYADSNREAKACLCGTKG